MLGAASSTTSIQVANMLRLFRIPQVLASCSHVTLHVFVFTPLSHKVSFFSTSPELSNKERFPYFLRTVPSDTNQAMAMVELVKLLGWTYISILYEESTYGIKVSSCVFHFIH